MAFHEDVARTVTAFSGGHHTNSLESTALFAGLSLITLAVVLHILTGGLSTVAAGAAFLNIGSTIGAWWTGGQAFGQILSIAMLLSAALLAPKLIQAIAHHDYHHPHTKKEV